MTVVRLRQSEHALVEETCIMHLFRRLGPAQAEFTIIEIVEQLGQHLHALDADIICQKFDTSAELACHACDLGEELGLSSFCRVLEDLQQACAQRDPVAVMAIWKRAQRIGDQSLSGLWQLPQLQI